MFAAVIGLADAGRVEAVGGEDVGPRGDEAARDPGDDLGPGQVEQIIIAALVVIELENTTIIGLGQTLGLDLGAIGPILDQDTARGFGADVGGDTQALTPSK